MLFLKQMTKLNEAVNIPEENNNTGCVSSLKLKPPDEDIRQTIL